LDSSVSLVYQKMQKGLTLELVYIILKTITEHTVGYSKNAWKNYQAYDFSNKHRFTMDFIVVDNPEAFSGNKIAAKKLGEQPQDKPKKIQDFNLDKLKGKIKEQVQYFKNKISRNNLRAVSRSTVILDKEIKCVEYAPDVFEYIRVKDGIEKTNLFESLSIENPENVAQALKAGEGLGKSGSFFFFSHDSRFLIKTMSTDDFNAFMKVFRAYFDHMELYPDSLIARIYGIYLVDNEFQDPVYLILMGNTKQIQSKFIKKVYDLKGSLVKREVKVKYHDKLGRFESSFKNTDCLKDINLLNMTQHEQVLFFNRKHIEGIVQKLRRDVVLLQKFNLMDYSMLFVVAYNPNYVEMFRDKFD
jgi:hypothetical protein